MEDREKIKTLEKLAQDVKKLKDEHRMKRPIVIEFCGAPKAGKTTCLNSLGDFLKRNGFRVKTVTEFAGSCPVSDKESPSFNIWTAIKAVECLIEELEKNNKEDVVLFDRGIFDSLCWFDWHHDSNRISDAEIEVMEDFFASERFIKYIDIVFVFNLEPIESLEREYTLNCLTNKPGSIMNEEVLYAYSKSVEKTCKKKLHPNIIMVNGENKIQDNVIDVANKTLEKLRELLTEAIGYYNKDDLPLRKFEESKCIKWDEIEKKFEKISFGQRHEIEDSFSYIQPIPIAVLTNKEKDKVLVIRKNEKNTGPVSPELKRDLIYVGGHVRKEDKFKEKDEIIEIFRNTLLREIKEELGIEISRDLLKTVPFLIYTPDGNKSNKHMAVCFMVEIDENTKLHLDSYELIQNKGKSKSGKFVDIDDIILDGHLEEWSQNILKIFFGRTVTLF